ncbi:MAG: hypothetical protein DMF19_09425 [Verrucomicrobia bacterium]|nr:MAG: hypothetical protein DMF19_09425 [Verrucomicrobiota bacterium]
MVARQVASNGSILEIGTISRNTVGAAIGQAVKKSGRTTGLSHSSIAGLNATISGEADRLPKPCLGMDSVLRRLKDAAMMPHFHHSIYETAQSTPPLDVAD